MRASTKNTAYYYKHRMVLSYYRAPFISKLTVPLIVLSRTHKFLQDILAISFGLALILPQSFFYGRPLLVTTTFTVWTISALGKNLIYAVKRLSGLLFLPTLFIGFVYLCQRHDNTTFRVIFMAGPIYCIMCCIVIGYYQIISPIRLQTIRSWILIFLTLFTISTIPHIIRNPTMTRILATDIPSELYHIQLLYSMGFLGYTQLYALAISYSTFILLFRSHKYLLFRILLGGALAYIAFIALYSSLLLLTSCMLFNLALVLFFLHRRLDVKMRFITPWIIGAFVFLILWNLESIMNFLPIPEFTIVKAQRFVHGLLTAGLIKGEITGRVEMFLNSCVVFLHKPFLGTGFTVESLGIGDHSSLIDPFAYFGVVGYLPMFIFQLIMTRSAYMNIRYTRNKIDATLHLIAWYIYWVVSALNNTVFVVLPIMLLFVNFIQMPRK